MEVWAIMSAVNFDKSDLSPVKNVGWNVFKLEMCHS